MLVDVLVARSCRNFLRACFTLLTSRQGQAPCRQLSVYELNSQCDIRVETTLNLHHINTRGSRLKDSIVQSDKVIWKEDVKSETFD
jgi:hypothetical protein